MALRYLPELGLGKLRTRGELVEFEVSELRFTLEETDQFTRQFHKIDLTEEEVKYLQDTTEGWVAGLQLSIPSPAWRNNFGNYQQPPTALSKKSLVTWQREDVLNQQPEEI